MSVEFPMTALAVRMAHAHGHPPPCAGAIAKAVRAEKAYQEASARLRTLALVRRSWEVIA